MLSKPAKMLWYVRQARRVPAIHGFIEAGCHDLHVARDMISPHLHTAQRYEIIIVGRGQHIDAINGRRWLVGAGHALIVRPGDTHGSSSLAQEPTKLSFLALDLSQDRPRFLDYRGTEAKEMRRELLAIDYPCFALTSLTINLWRTAMDAIRQSGLPNRPNVIAIRQARAYLPAFLQALLESFRTREQFHAETLSQRVDAMVADRLDRHFSVAELAQVFCMSASSFQTRFKKETGIAPINYILRKKIHMAKAFLQNSDEPITRIAVRFGFSSSQNFATAFRRIVGWSPTECRQRAGRRVVE